MALVPDIDKVAERIGKLLRAEPRVLAALLIGGVATAALYHAVVIPAWNPSPGTAPVPVAQREEASGQPAASVARAFRSHRDSPNLMIEVALAVFDATEDGTQGSYFALTDLCSLIDQPTVLADVEGGGDIALLRRFIASVARHQATYESKHFRRGHDPGFYRHFVMATAFDKVGASLDPAEPEAQSAKDWAILFYARFLANVNAGRLRQKKYSATVTQAVAQAKERSTALIAESSLSGGPVGLALLSAIGRERFNTVLDVLRGAGPDRRTLAELLNKPSLTADRLWSR
jgi:hypothetical protein